MNRYLSSFLIASTIYIIIMGIVFYFLNKDNTYQADVKAKEISKIKFLILAVPEKQDIEPKIEKKVEQKPKLKQKIEQKQKPKLKTQTKKIIQAKQELVKEIIIEEPILEPEPVEKVIIEQSTYEPEAQKEVILEVIEPIVQENILKQEELQEQIKAANIASALEHKRDIFIANLVERINSNKSYPNMARRRVIEGSVEVKFKILSDGDVRDIEIVTGKRVFKKSAVQAIDRSFPMEVDSKLFDFPKEFKITIIYVLK